MPKRKSTAQKEAAAYKQSPQYMSTHWRDVQAIRLQEGRLQAEKGEEPGPGGVWGSDLYAPVTSRRSSEYTLHRRGVSLMNPYGNPAKNITMIEGRPVQVSKSLRRGVSRTVCLYADILACLISRSPLSARIFIQVLVLTHEKASPQELDAYLSALWQGVPVVGVYGRSASMEPPCDAEHAVFFGWRE